MEKKYQIFISSTYLDLIEERSIVKETILKLEHIPMGMEMFNAGNDEQWELIKRSIDNSDYYIVIIGFRYGSTSSNGTSYTEKEYDYAVSKGLPVLAFIQDRNTPVVSAKTEKTAKAKKRLCIFIEKAKSRMADFWNDKNQLATQISTALQSEMKQRPRTGWIRSTELDRMKDEINSLIIQNQNLKLALQDSTASSTSRQATLNEIMEQTTKIDLLDTEYSNGGLPVLIRDNDIYIDDSDSHTLIIGSTGSGKTRRLILPLVNILARSGESMFIVDPKGEVYNNCKNILALMGYAIKLLNLREPEKSDCWNPLAIPYSYYSMGDIDRATEFVMDLSKNIFNEPDPRDTFWIDSAANYFVGLTLLLFECGKENEINLNSMYAFSKSGLLEKYVSKIDSSSPAYISLSGIMLAPEGTKASILSVFNQKLTSFITHRRMSYILSKNDFDISSLVEYKTAFIIILHDEKSTYYPLVSAFIKQCYQATIHKAYEFMNFSLPNRLNFILDEFANITPISDISNMITAARSRNIRFYLAIQGMSQLEHRYGTYTAQVIKSNCSNWVYLLCKELSVLHEISELSGYSEDGKKPLLNMLQLQRLQVGEVLFLKGRMYPFISILPDISGYDEWKIISS